MRTSHLEIRPVSARIGAEIAGVDLATELDAAIVAQIRETLLHWKVVFFRDQHLEPDTQLAFARRFGPVTTAHPTVPGLEEHPDVFDVDAQGGYWMRSVIETPGQIGPPKPKPRTRPSSRVSKRRR